MKKGTTTSIVYTGSGEEITVYSCQKTDGKEESIARFEFVETLNKSQVNQKIVEDCEIDGIHEE